MSHVTKLAWLALDHSASTPVHSQIEEQIRHAVARGKLSPGERLPAVRDLAVAVGVHANTAARAYGALVRDGVLMTRRGGGTFVAAPDSAPRLRETQDARLGAIVGRALVEAASLGFSPEETEAAFTLHVARWREETHAPVTRRAPASRRARALVVMGSHDIALDLLANYLRRRARVQMTSTHVGSLGGLIALARGEAQVAGCHLLDAETGEYNLPFVKRVLAGIPTNVVTLVGRVQGLLVQKGNPMGIRGLPDLARPDVCIVNRQKGSGTRVLLDYMLSKAGLDPRALHECDIEAETHTEVAAAVASGQADAGLGILPAARALGLDFIPLHHERYDVVVPRAHWDTPPVVALRAAMVSPDFKASVGELGGYDTSHTGSVVAELNG